MNWTALTGALTALLLLAACAAPDPTAEGVRVVSASATVQEVDTATRTLTLRDDATGETFSVVAGPEVRNFAQIGAGDRIEMDFVEATVLGMADPADTGEPAVLVAGGRAPEGGTPGAGGLVATSVVVEVISYDADTGFATFRLPDGTVRRSVLAPSLRSFAAARRPGDRVLVTLTDAVAISVVPAGS